MQKKIGIDFHILSQKYQGSRTYLFNIIHQLMKLDKENLYYIYVNNKNDFSPLQDKAKKIAVENFVPKEYIFKSRILRLGINIPFFEYKDKLDIFHTQYIVPLFSLGKQIVTIHDILYESHPQFFSKTFIARSRILIRNSAHKASKILTDSVFSKSQLIEIYKIPEQKIEIIYGGADREIFNPRNKKNAIENIFKKYKIRNFILNVGRLEPRKNQITLVKSYHELLKTYDIEEKLVIIGPKDYNFSPIYRYIFENNLVNHVYIFNTIGDQELPFFYKAATLFVYPSYAEGFGLPILEAMACGIPVIGSNTSSIPEVVGDCGILIDPHKMEDLTNAIKKLIDSPSLKAKQSEKAIERSKNFTWKNAALKTLKIYNELSSD